METSVSRLVRFARDSIIGPVWEAQAADHRNLNNPVDVSIINRALLRGLPPPPPRSPTSGSLGGPGSGNISSSMSFLPVGGQLPALPDEAWGAIARAVLLAEGSDMDAWRRLRLVNRACRAGVTGETRQPSRI